MNYSIAKMVEYALSYILLNELLTKKYEMSEDTRQIVIKYFNKRIEEIRNQHK
jgi:hypothetical protein